jgi:hypothetical protein
MSGKATAVFWLGLILIMLNFWISGQSTTFWNAITLKPATTTGGSSSTATTPTTTNYSEGQVAGANQTIVNVAGRGK